MATHRSLISVATVLIALGCAQSNEDAESGETVATTSTVARPLEGAWRVAEMTTASGATIAQPASLFLFHGSHYSVMYASGAQPRKTYVAPGTPTTAEKVQAYDTFIANSGAYQMAGDTLITRPVISKNPNYMGGGEDRFVVRISADTLWLTSVPGALRFAVGQIASPASTTGDQFKLIRL
jgi:hypothetical protein